MKPITSERAYGYRSFEHFKRETFPIIADIAAKIDGPIRMADISCGPAVLEGILLTKLGGRIKKIHLLDIEQGFLDTAKEYLAEFKADIATHLFDLNAPGKYPCITGLNLIVSTNGIFHATAENLPKLYRWCHKVLAKGGVFVNHQTFGSSAKGFDKVLKQYCGCLDSKAVLDDLDRELARRSQIDTKLAGGPVNTEKGGGYAGLQLTVFQHLEILRDAGFTADEIWRKGTSGMILAIKQ